MQTTPEQIVQEGINGFTFLISNETRELTKKLSLETAQSILDKYRIGEGDNLNIPDDNVEQIKEQLRQAIYQSVQKAVHITNR